ncbi:hypothetical protein [Sinomonas sp. RB5]
MNKLMQLRGGRGVSAAATAAALVLGGGAAASAYWGTTGSGSGSQTAGQLQVLTTEALAQPAGGQQPITPGGVADAAVRVTNPNPYPVELYSVASAGPATADAAHAQCVTTGITFQNPAVPLAPTVTVPASGSLTVVLPGAVAMDLTSDPGCQGASFRIPLTLEVRK